MKFLSSLILSLFLVIGAQPASAGVAVQVTGIYLADDFTQTSTASQSRQLYSAELLYSFSKLKNVYFGLGYWGLAQNDSSGTSATQFSAQDTSAFMQMEFDRSRRWLVAAGYNWSAKATYATQGSAEKQWDGSAYWLRVGGQVNFKKNYFAGLHLLYYMASYPYQTQNGTQSNVEVSRTWTVPVLSLSYAP